MRVRDQWHLLCPECKKDEGFTISFTGTARLTSEGTEDAGDHEWHDESSLSCDCGWDGIVGQAAEAYKEWSEEQVGDETDS
jgi:hypothetical protein